MFHMRFLNKHFSVTSNARLISVTFPLLFVSERQVTGLSLCVLLIPKNFIQRIKFLYCLLRGNVFLLISQGSEERIYCLNVNAQDVLNVFRFFIKGINSNHVLFL